MERREQPSLSDLDESSQRPSEPPGSGIIERIAEPEKIYSGSQNAQQGKPVLESMLFTQLGLGLDELAGTLRSRLYDTAGNVVKEVPIRELLQTVQSASNCYAIVLDGVITQRLVELGLQKGVKAIYGVRANQMQRRHPDIILYTKENGKLE